MSETWPRLSDRVGPRALSRCQACGGVGEVTWQECDEADQPELIYVRLCRPCSDRIIEPHPRLYKQVARGEPAPGAMNCCIDCLHQQFLRCQSPLLKINGGPGMEVLVRPVGFACSRGKGGRCRTLYDGEPVCRGREPPEAAGPKEDKF